MRIVTSDGPDRPLELREVASRPLRPGEVRVATRAIGVNPVDWKMKAGQGPLRLLHRVVGPSGPFVCGVDFAGDVVEVHPSVDALAVGDRVVGGTDFSRGQLGSYADEVVVRPDQCARLPASVSYEAAACLPIPYSTAHGALVTLSGVGAGGRVLVLGASGGVGLTCLGLARALGAHAVGVCSARNVARVESLGARAVDYGAGDPLVAAAAFGPYDAIVNAVGTATYPIGACRALLGPRGHLVLVDVKPSDVPAVACLPRVHGILGRPHRAVLEQAVAHLEQGALATVVEARFPLADAEAAHERSRGGKVVGKLLLLP